MRFSIAAAIAGLCACAPPAPPPATPPPEVAPGTSAVRPTAALLDPYAGRYAHGSGALTIRRIADTLVVEREGQNPVTLALVGRGAFTDIHGAAYLFNQGTDLTIVSPDGRRSVWRR